MKASKFGLIDDKLYRKSVFGPSRTNCAPLEASGKGPTISGWSTGLRQHHYHRNNQVYLE